MPGVRVVVYRVTGKQGFFHVPESWCEECDLTVSTVERAAARARVPVDVVVRPWWIHIVPALVKRGWHPPVVLVEGRKIVQGRVPVDEELDIAIEQAAARGASN